MKPTTKEFIDIIHYISEDKFTFLWIKPPQFGYSAVQSYHALQNKSSIVGEPETALCQYLVKYLSGVLMKKTKVIDIFYTDKKCVIQFNVD